MKKIEKYCNQIVKTLYFIDSEELIQFKTKHYNIQLKYSKLKQILYYNLTNQVNNKRCNFEIENFVLGGCLKSTKVLNNFLERASKYSIKNKKQKIILNSIFYLILNDDKINSKNVIKTLMAKNELLTAGGKTYIENLTVGVNINSDFLLLNLLIQYSYKTIQYNFEKDLNYINIPLNKVI